VQTDRQTDRQTDMTKTKDAFAVQVNVSKNEYMVFIAKDERRR
jgi:hypothetical protein